ncbi:MAG: HAD family hydrolase [Acuticoccus sp.]
MSTLRLVLFDCDGTLVDSAAHILGAMRGAFERHDLVPPSDDEIKSIIGLSLPHAVGRLASKHPEAPHAEMVEAYKDIYRDAMAPGADTEPLFEGVRAVLDALSADEGTLLGVATGKSRAGLDRILAGHDLKDRFVTTMTADDAPSKPAPEMVLRAIEATGVSPVRTVMIGDSAFDMQMAHAAGVRALGVAWGYQPVTTLTEAGAESVAHRVDELPACITELVG